MLRGVFGVTRKALVVTGSREVSFSGGSTNLSSKVSLTTVQRDDSPGCPLPVLGHWIRHVTNA